MAIRIATYRQAFEDILNIPFSDRLQSLVARLEQEGHTEKSICFTIWKTQDKLSIFKRDRRFFSILENEVNKWSWKKDDPRWKEYWKKKEEEKRAKRIRKEIDAIRNEDNAFAEIGNNEKKKRKKFDGYVYFIQGQCGGAIKIGYSVAPEKRLRMLQTGYPDTLVILLLIPGNEATEVALHRKFAASRLNGEWFRPDDYVIETMKELKCKVSQT